MVTQRMNLYLVFGLSLVALKCMELHVELKLSSMTKSIFFCSAQIFKRNYISGAFVRIKMFFLANCR